MSQEGSGAGGESIGASLEQHDQISDLGVWQSYIVAQQVQGCAQTADHRDRLVDRLGEAVANRNWVISPDHLPEVSGCGQLVVQAAVDHDVFTAAGLFTVQHPGDVDPALADD